MDEKSEVIEMTADIVSAYVGNNTIATSDLPALIQSVHRALANITGGAEPAEVAPKEPAVPVRRSITPDYLICLEDGRKFKSLKRHLRTKYNMSPEEYRAKWNLPKEYPMVAPELRRGPLGTRQADGPRPGRPAGGPRRRQAPLAIQPCRGIGARAPANRPAGSSFCRGLRRLDSGRRKSRWRRICASTDSLSER